MKKNSNTYKIPFVLIALVLLLGFIPNASASNFTTIITSQPTKSSSIFDFTANYPTHNNVEIVIPGEKSNVVIKPGDTVVIRVPLTFGSRSSFPVSVTGPSFNNTNSGSSFAHGTNIGHATVEPDKNCRFTWFTDSTLIPGEYTIYVMGDGFNFAATGITVLDETTVIPTTAIQTSPNPVVTQMPVTLPSKKDGVLTWFTDMCHASPVCNMIFPA